MKRTDPRISARARAIFILADLDLSVAVKTVGRGKRSGAVAARHKFASGGLCRGDDCEGCNLIFLKI